MTHRLFAVGAVAVGLSIMNSPPSAAQDLDPAGDRNAVAARTLDGGRPLLPAAASLPALVQNRGSDFDRDRTAAERTLDRSRPFRLLGGVGAALSVAAMFMSEEQRTSGAGTAMAAGGLATLGLGLIGDIGRYRGATRLDALRGTAGGGLDSRARADAERALRQGRRLQLVGAVGSAMVLATPFLPGLCTGSDRCDTSDKAYLAGGVAALGLGILGMVKAGRAESRLDTLGERRASHGIGVAPLRDGVAANYSLAW